jgi:hypothetical protein
MTRKDKETEFAERDVGLRRVDYRVRWGIAQELKPFEER